MIRYFFHLYNDEFVDDLEGKLLDDQAAARTYAIANIRELICEDVSRGRVCLKHRIEVANQAGERLFTVPFVAAVTIEQ